MALATPLPRTDPRASVIVFGVLVALGVPTALAPGTLVADVTYLAGLAVVVATLWTGARRWRDGGRHAWRMLAVAASCWLAGDIVQRLMSAAGHESDSAGPQDLFWLASYPFVVAGVAAMVRGRGVSTTVRREIRMDVTVVTIAGALGAWKFMIAPELNDQTLTVSLVLTILYPLGDVALFGTALTLLMTPGRRGIASRMVVACLGLTLVVDAAFAALPHLAPRFDTGRMDGALLTINGLLAAAVLQPSAGRLAEPSLDDDSSRLSRWRVVLLGAALVTVTVAAVLPVAHSTGMDAVVLLVAAAVTSVTVVARFYNVVRQREAAERLLAHEATHDHLTGLANRSLLLSRIDEELAACALDRRASLLLLYLDLDGFKSINDLYGHAAGDTVLCTVGARLRRLTRATDTVARIGGDEFVILCRDVTDTVVDGLGDELCASVAEPITVADGSTVTVGVSVGVARLPVPENVAELIRCDSEGLLGAADMAMYRAKCAGGGTWLAEAS